MKSSISCVGLTFTGIYFIGTISYGSIQMDKSCAPARAARKNYDLAEKEATAATNAYNTALSNWQLANAKINDAQCAENSIPDFVNQTADFCNGDGLDKYQINLGLVANQGPSRTTARIWDHITQLEPDCKIAHDYTQRFCSDNCITWSCARYCEPQDLVCYKVQTTSNGDVCVDTRSTFNRRGCWFDRITDRYDYYGIIASGSSNIQMQCGQFSHSLSTRAEETINSDITSNSAIQAGRVVQQKREISHGSVIKFDSKVPQTNTATLAVPTSHPNLQQVNDALLLFIKQQCKSAQRNIQSAVYFSQIKNSTLAQLPQLSETINITKQAMQDAKETMNGKKAVLDQASQVCNQSLATWLPTILIPSAVLGFIFSRYDFKNVEQMIKERFKNTHKPILFSRPNQSATNQPQAAELNDVEFADAVFAEPVYSADCAESNEKTAKDAPAITLV